MRIKEPKTENTRQKNFRRNEYRQLLRDEAEERQRIRGRFSNKEQLAKLDAGGFVAKKERNRLCNQHN